MLNTILQQIIILQKHDQMIPDDSFKYPTNIGDVRLWPVVTRLTCLSFLLGNSSHVCLLPLHWHLRPALFSEIHEKVKNQDQRQLDHSYTNFLVKEEPNSSVSAALLSANQLI